MIRYLKHNEIDKSRWDQCMNSALNRLIYGYSWYLDIVSPGWDALVLDDFEAVMPLTWRRKMGLKYLVQPYLSQQLGVFGSMDAMSLTEAFIDAIPGKFLSTRINLNQWNKLSLEKHSLVENVNYELSLNTDYNHLQASFSKSNRKNIAKAEKYNLEIKEIHESKTFIDLARPFLSRQIKVDERFYRIFNRITKTCLNKNVCKLYGVYTADGSPCSLFLLWYMNNRWIQQFSLNLQEGRKLKAMFFFINEFLKEHAGQNEIYDFEGSNIRGVADFFKGFGSTKKTYYYLSANRIPFLKRIPV